MNRVILFLLTLIILASCKPESTTGPSDTNTLAIDTGTLVGNVYAWSITGNTPLAEVKVSLDSTPYSTVTDSKGIYTLTATTNKHHTLTFSKPGYGDIKVFDLAFAAPGKLRVYQKPVLAEVPTFVPVQLTAANFTDTLGQKITLITAKQKLVQPEVRKGFTAILYFYDSDPSASADINPVFIIPLSGKTSFTDPANGVDTCRLPLANSALFEKGIVKGKEYYLAIRLSNVLLAYSAGFYFDPFTNQYIYTAVGPESAAIKVVIE